MTSARASVLRQMLAVVLLAVLTLSGAGRAVALATAEPQPVTIAGVVAPICHAGGGSPSAPATPAHHDCCDACALCAPVALPAGATLVEPARVEHYATHARAVAWAPAVARVPTPRLSQGPPAA